MNTFDIAIYLGLIIAVATGFSTGLIRSAITILAYIVAMPIAVWVMSFVPPLTENTNSPLMQNAGFFLGAFLVIGMVIGKLARIPIDDAIGAPTFVDRLGGATLGVVRVGLVATSVVLVFDQLIPVVPSARLPAGLAIAPLLLRDGPEGRSRAAARAHGDHRPSEARAAHLKRAPDCLPMHFGRPHALIRANRVG